MKNTMIELEKQFHRCPKCGGMPIITSYTGWHDGSYAIDVECLNCSLTLNFSSDYGRTDIRWNYSERSNDTVVDVWNKGINVCLD